MTGIVLILRILAEAGAVAGPLLIWLYRPRPALRAPDSVPESGEETRPGSRTPLIANALTIGAFFSCLWGPFGWPMPPRAYLAIAATGLGVVIAGLFVALSARGALGASWSFAPKASPLTGLATSGPYRWVRHPIYLGMALMFLGTALAFANWLATLLVLFAIVPTLVWRAAVEERLLVRVFGDRYVAYRARTKVIIPFVL